MVDKGKTFQVAANLIMIVLTLFCLLPFLLLIISSITQENALVRNGYSFFPEQIDFAAYKYLLVDSTSIVRGYILSAFVTVTGTVANLAVTTLFAYPLSRRDLPGRAFISFFLFFTMLFNGGLVPSYIMWTQTFHIKNTIAALLFPNLMMGAFYVIMMRTYFTTNIPEAVIEAARIDGAGELKIFWRIVMPNVKPAWLTTMIFVFQTIWNTSGLTQTTTIVYDEKIKMVSALMNQVAAGGTARAGAGAALGFLLMIPPVLLFMATQSRIIETMSTSGMK